MSVAPRVGVCSWSLQPRSARELADQLRALNTPGLGVQLALEPIRAGHPGWGEIETINALRDANIPIISGMMEMLGEDYSSLNSIARTGGVRPDATWAHNRAAAIQIAHIARRLGLKLVTFHAGFIPHDDTPERSIMLSRLRELADIFDHRGGIRVAFETGQESAETLEHALNELDCPYVGINFDPANMILYGMEGGGDPCDALERLAPRVVQVHIKDALPTRTPGTWGSEVRTGTGAVDWTRFFSILRSKRLAVDRVIEREAGATRLGDISHAIALVHQHSI